MAIETEQAPNRLFEPLAPPIPKGEIHRTTSRGRQRLQQRCELLAISRVHISQFWQQSLKLQGQLIGAEGPMPRIKSPVSPRPLLPSMLKVSSRCSTWAVVPRLIARGTALVREKRRRDQPIARIRQSPSWHKLAVAHTKEDFTVVGLQDRHPLWPSPVPSAPVLPRPLHPPLGTSSNAAATGSPRLAAR